MENVRTTLFLPKKYHRALKSLAHERGTSMARLIQEALEKTLFRKQQKKAKDLWGCTKKTDLAEADFQALKAQLNPK
jgi:hypothetical protein